MTVMKLQQSYSSLIEEELSRNIVTMPATLNKVTLFYLE